MISHTRRVLQLSEAKWGGQYRTLKELERALKSVLTRYRKGLAKAENSSEVDALKIKAREALNDYEIRWIAHPDAVDVRMGVPDAERKRLEALTKQDQERAGKMLDAAAAELATLADKRKVEISSERDARSAQLDRERRDRGAAMGGYEKELELMRLSRQ